MAVDLSALITAVQALVTAAQANSDRWNAKCTALQTALTAAQAAAVVIPDDLLTAIEGVTSSLTASP